MRHPRNGKSVQRYLCRRCGYRFSEPNVKVNVSGQVFERSKSMDDLSHNVISNLDSSLKESVNDFSLFGREDIGSHEVTIVGQDLNTFRDYRSTRRVCVSEGEMKNLVEVEPRTEAGQRETTTDGQNSLRFAWELKKRGYAENTIARRVRLLKTLVNSGANLMDTESVKEAIARKDSWSNKTKELAVAAYTSFLKVFGGKWEPPSYQKITKLPFIPLEKEVDALISGCNRKTATFLQLLKETGMRCGEAWQLKWTDLDFENRVVSVTPEKGSDPRVLSVSNRCVAMLKALPMNQEQIFAGSLRHFARSFRRQRKKVVNKLKEPRIERIHFHTLRHYFATMDYHRNKDILRTMRKLGHRNIQNTLLYTQLVNFGENDWIARVAYNVDEAVGLVKAGFDYVTGSFDDGGKIFRKRE